MSLQVRPLLRPYAQAAGETIIARIKSHGALPTMLKDEYDAWLDAHQALSRLPHATEARHLDPFVDRAVLLPAHLCKEIVQAYASVPVPLTASQRQRFDDARKLVAIFGNDLRALVNIPFVEEWSAVRDLLRRLTEDKELAAAVKRLGLTDDIELCTTLHEAYGKALGIGASGTKDAPEHKVASWNDTFRTLLVGAAFLEKKTPGLYAVFSEPHAEQLRRQQEMLARQRAPRGGVSSEETDSNETPSGGGGNGGGTA